MKKLILTAFMTTLLTAGFVSPATANGYFSVSVDLGYVIGAIAGIGHHHRHHYRRHGHHSRGYQNRGQKHYSDRHGSRRYSNYSYRLHRPSYKQHYYNGSKGHGPGYYRNRHFSDYDDGYYDNRRYRHNSRRHYRHNDHNFGYSRNVFYGKPRHRALYNHR